MAEQRHKREMNEAVRGDFERLRARRQRRPPVAEKPVVRPERIVLTPPQPAAEAAETEGPETDRHDARETQAPEAERRSWLRSVLRRG